MTSIYKLAFFASQRNRLNTETGCRHLPTLLVSSTYVVKGFWVLWELSWAEHFIKFLYWLLYCYTSFTDDRHQTLDWTVGFLIFLHYFAAVHWYYAFLFPFIQPSMSSIKLNLAPETLTVAISVAYIFISKKHAKKKQLSIHPLNCQKLRKDILNITRIHFRNLVLKYTTSDEFVQGVYMVCQTSQFWASEQVCINIFPL